MARTPYTGSTTGATRVPYTGGAAATRQPYTGQTQATPPEHHGTLVGNFLHGANEAVHGFVPAVVTTAGAVAHDLTHPAFGTDVGPLRVGIPFVGGDVQHKVVEPVLKSEADYYAPLAHGDLGGFYQNFHENPFVGVADFLTLVSGGTSRIAALSKIEKGAGVGAVTKAALTGRTTGELQTLTGRAAHGGADVTLRTLPRNAGRAARMQLVDKALKKLPEDTRLLGEFARAARAARRDALPVQLRHLADTRYVTYLRTFARLNKDQRVAVALLARVPLAHDLHAWVASVQEHGDDASKSLAKQVARPGVMAAYENPVGKVAAALEAARTLADARQTILQHHGALTAGTAADAPFRHMQAIRGDTPTADLRAEIAAAGRPQPFYLPDVAVTPKRTYLGGSAGSGLTPQRALADVKQSHLVLFRAGALMLHPDVLGPAFLRAAKHDYYTALHDKVKELAVAIPQGQRLPHGYEWVRETRGQKMPYLDTNMEQHLHDVQEVFGGHLHEEKPLTHVDDGEPIALDEQGNRLAVSGAFAREFAGEFHRASEFTRLVNKYPMRIWRALILNARIPWLVNNILGNTILYAIRNSGPAGLKGFVGMVAQTKGATAVREMLHIAESEAHLTRADISEIFPEAAHGTFIGTNLPKFGKTGSVGQKIAQGLAPIDRASEGGLRRAATEAALRKDPKVKAIYQAMPKQTRSMREAMRQAAGDENLRRLVVREVNDTLGDYLTMRPAERGAIRNTVPFYAWFREILRITGKLAIDTPGRADLISKVGAVGAEQEGGPWPSYLQGSLAVGAPQGDIQNILALQGANPLMSATAVLSGRNPAGELNPFLGAAAKLVAGGTLKNPTNLWKLAPETLKQVGLALPETRIVTNPPSRLYPHRTREDLIKQFLGDPRRQVSLRQAHYYASQGR